MTDKSVAPCDIVGAAGVETAGAAAQPEEESMVAAEDAAW
jgi:hypothetical protein